MKNSEHRKATAQLVWAVALILMGLALFFYIPQDPRFAEISQSSAKTGYIKLCFYLIAVLLVGGGVRKIVLYVRPAESTDGSGPSDNTDN